MDEGKQRKQIINVRRKRIGKREDKILTKEERTFKKIILSTELSLKHTR